MNKTLIIAEAGVNHNGDLALAKDLIDVASDAGADLIKFQSFQAEYLVTKKAKKAPYQISNMGTEESQYEMLKALELDEKAHNVLLEHCNKKNIGFLSTPFDLFSLELLSRIGLSTIKISSGDLTNDILLSEAGRLGRNIILSTGMSTLDEVGHAVTTLTTAGLATENLTLLHCLTDYPANKNETNLRAMEAMRSEFEVKVGYSDHTTGIEISLAAVALGAEIIEKHFTLDRNMSGPDHKASIEPEELCLMVSSIRNIESALGNGLKAPAPSELKNISVCRKSIVAMNNIKVGDIFTTDNISVKRPGTGLSPTKFHKILGKPAPRNYAPDDQIDIEP